MSHTDTTTETTDRTETADDPRGHDSDSEQKIHATDLRVGYPGLEEPVVDTETLVVPEGEVTALVGPNGSGKSTLLKALARHLDAETGDVLIDGREIAEFGSKEFARELGMLSQHGATPDGITVEELVGHGRYPYKGFLEGQTEDDREAIERAISLSGIEHLREKDVSSLSGGQRQLVRIAMALAQETDTLLLDEPTTYLDLRHQLQVMEVIRTLNEERGVTVCIVLHDLTQAARFADYLVALRDGDIYDWGRPEDVVTEALLAEVFGVEAVVEYGAEPRIVPKRALE
ncbi:ABC transporter ATP-binding protein [Halarchaeum nitratireducens]|uniref:Cobalamin import ATP-binding protein BtuD n=1 Tax=Halarchaeum nitratireducens TaxID=489913 RepID=A0A830G7D3_9EURY|nr:MULTISPECIES: ABC transporter ATP-binding protein [Halarchaeum]MBP2251947.1 iron complex transport system ATP-binding protein [Halarchaeum solikamskense]GGN05886.1 ferrichrome ABC transporter ATP-binding protein [Halarchaeum nitratireducens]